MKRYRPEELSAMVLGKLKAAAELHFGNREVRNVVITVPAYFSNAQRQVSVQSTSPFPTAEQLGPNRFLVSNLGCLQRLVQAVVQTALAGLRVVRHGLEGPVGARPSAASVPLQGDKR